LSRREVAERHHADDRVVGVEDREQRTFSVMTSATSDSCATMPSATPRTAMSRSVTMPTIAWPSSTGSEPTSMSRIRRAAACSVSSRCTVATLFVMIWAIVVMAASSAVRRQG